MKLYSLAFLLFLSSAVHAQTPTVQHQVFFSTGGKITCVPFGNKGFIVIKDHINEFIKKKEHVIYKLDENLNLVDSFVIYSHQAMHVCLKTQTENALFFVLYGYPLGMASMVLVDFDLFTVKEIPIFFKTYSNLAGLTYCENTLYLGLSMRSTPMVIAVNINDGSVTRKVFPRGKLKYNMIVGVDSDTTARLTFIAIGYKTKANHFGVEVQIWNETGECIKKIPLSGKDDRNLTSIKCLRISQNQYLFAGTYSYTKKRSGEGLFLAKFNNDNRDFLHYYPFLDNFDYLQMLHPTTHSRALKNMHKFKHGRKYPDCEFRMIPNSLAATKDRYFFVGEFYYEDFAIAHRSSAINGVQHYDVFLGHKQSNAGVFSFDHSGNKQYDVIVRLFLPHVTSIPMRILPVTIDSANNCRLHIPTYGNFECVVDAVGKFSTFPGPVIPTPNGYEPTNRIWWILNIEPYSDDFLMVVGVKNIGETSFKGTKRWFFIEKISRKSP
jgi:hypothetical protein